MTVHADSSTKYNPAWLWEIRGKLAGTIAGLKTIKPPANVRGSIPEKQGGSYKLRYVVTAVMRASAAPSFIDMSLLKVVTKPFRPYHNKNAIVK